MIVAEWLRYLSAHHPDYRHYEFSVENLETLPLDGSIHHQLPTRGVNKLLNNSQNDPPTSPGDDPNNEDEVDPDPRTAIMPDLLADQTKVQRLQKAMERAPQTGQTKPPPHQQPD